MTDHQRMLVTALREKGMGYGSIASRVGVPVNTVKSFCRRRASSHSVENPEPVMHRCLCCGVTVEQKPGRKEKKFCSDKCRNKWWNRHTNLMKENYVCVHCGKPFHGRKGRKYCSHACYMAERFGGRHAS